MTYLDTQVVVWMASGALDKITPAAQRHLRQDDLKVSPMVLLELEYLFEIQRILLPARDVLLKVQHELMVSVCDLGFPDVVTLGTAEKWTRDPFDRLIVAQAKANGLAFLISSDELIRRNYPRTVW